MAAKHSAYRISIPTLTQEQEQKLTRWCQRSTRAYELTDDGQLVLNLGEERTPKEIGNIIRIYLKRWGVSSMPRYQRNVVTGLSETEFWKTVEPSDLTAKILKGVYKRSDEILTKRHSHYMAIARSLARALESAIAKNTKSCTTSAWRELVTPVRLRKEKERHAEMDERRRRELVHRAERQRLLEEENKQREEEAAQKKIKEREWDIKRARLQKEYQEMFPGVYGAICPRDMEHINTLHDIPWVAEELRARGLL